ncbi:MAG TPA: DUF1573 domain-containing protein [Thermoanaerobaculia bacterium]|jgi:hypothetical protein
MSSDDFGTINVRRGERAREIEVMRQHYRQHRDALQRMTADAPTEHLAAEYTRLVVEIDRSLAKLEELEGKTPAPPTAPPAHEPTRPHGDPLAAQRPSAPSAPQVSTHPARRGQEPAIADAPAIPPPGTGEERSRLPLILAAALVALALIGWLIWRASSDRDPAETVVEERPVAAAGTDTAEGGTTAADDTIAPAGAPIPTGIAAAPEAHDFGVVRKGTRATRQYELTNTTDEPLSITVARSACRCLFYEHAPVIPPNAKESLTVTVDGARAKPGELHEQIRITSKADAAVTTTIDVNATIR